MVSAEIAARSVHFRAKCLHALINYDGWSKDNDPWKEADFCTLDIDGEKVFAKLDYFEKGTGFMAGAEDPSNPLTTDRIAVLMFPSEY